MSKMTRFFSGAVFAIVLLFGVGALSPQAAQAASLTSDQISAIIGLLQSFGADQSVVANVQTTLGGTATGGSTKAFCYNFNTDFGIGSRGGGMTSQSDDRQQDIRSLRTALIQNGVEGANDLSNGDQMSESVSFDESYAAAAVQFQAKYGIRQTGYVGPITRKKLNSLYGCSVTTDPLPSLPFCGQPPMPTCSVGLACIQMMPQPKTYTNYTDYKNDKATYLYSGYCNSPTSIPTISSLSPSSGPMGTSVTITGSGFTATNNSVKFGGGYLNGISSNGTAITFTVPDGLTPCAPNAEMCAQSFMQVKPGVYPVSVINANGTSNIVNFAVPVLWY